MEDHAAVGMTVWQREVQEEAEEEYPPRIAAAVAHPERYSDPERFPKLALLVSGAVMVQKTLAPELTRVLLGLAFDVALTVGASSRFREHEEFGRSVLALIDVLDETGAPVSGLLLSAARFQALFANGDRSRLDLIVRAVAASRTADERIAALLTMSRSRTDISDYQGARAALAECALLVRQESTSHWGAEYEHSLGLTHYYADPERAAAHFEKSVELGRSVIDRPGVSQAVASSLHYLGRFSAERRDYARALDLYAEGERLSDRRLSSHGYYHQRVAEILVVHGTIEEAAYHLTRSQQTFDQAAQRSSALALLGGTWTDFFLRTGDLDQAEDAVADAIKLSRKEEGGARIELVLLAKRLRLLIRQRRLSALLVLLCRAAWLYVREELDHNPVTAVRQTLVVARQGARMVRPGGGSPGRQPLICPCGEDHRAGGTAG
ncbi:tetratricopeptide repeat protein [Streptomyces sp. ActVer]|uniref:tetratricopeptide repeat protein n=1 Tax=Streptomyces sp. ActVer TaxID=3014558 RepID=UPI0022B477EA|nr:tetratricopeptide repeat protein [Streptomyces sp. ActVer]MCZ4509778.1 tetratricopeptide repeat protein [Streptomyces sp. ActVer]